MKRIDLIKRLFEEPIKIYGYEVYEWIDMVKRVRTFVVLDDELNTVIDLEEVGIYSKELIDFLESKGYKEINKAKLLTKR